LPGLLPRRRGRKVHISTIYRWVKQGVGGRRLETVKIGGLLYTSAEALSTFANRSGDEPGGDTSQPSPRRQREIDRAEQEADDLGLGSFIESEPPTV